MTVFRSMLLLASAALTLSAADLTGTWKAVFTCPPEKRPKMVSEMVFHLTAQGDRITGTAHMATWPGDGSLTGGRVEGNHFTFTVITQNAWRSSGPAGQASGLPKLTFSGTVEGGEMEIALVWDSVMLYGNAGPPAEFTMRGKRID
jgi:hypothetical protein